MRLSSLVSLAPLLLLLTAAGCSGGEPQGSAGGATGSGPEAAPAAPAAPAAAPATGSDAAVGPDGPEDLAIPDVSSVPSSPEAIANGEKVFQARGCAACHAFGSKLVGPDLTGVMDRRSARWTARMIRHPEAMTKRDPVAKGLFATHMTQMSNQQVADGEMADLLGFLASKKGN